MSLQEIEQLERDKQAIQAEIRALEREISQSEMSQGTSRQDTQRVNNEINSLRHENENLRNTIRSGVLSGPGANRYITVYRDVLREEIYRLRNEYDQLRRDHQNRTGRFSRSSQFSNPREFSRLQVENNNLTRENRRLTGRNSALTKENEEYVKNLRTAGKDTAAKKTILDVLKLASDALQASTIAEDTASSAKTDAENLVKVAEAAATNAGQSDRGSLPALAAENAAKNAKDAQKIVVQEVGKVQKASREVETLAKTFIADTSKVGDTKKQNLSTAKGNLTKRLNALNAAMEKVNKASTEATTQAGLAMNIHDNWETLGPLFGFKPPTAIGVKDKGKVETKPLPTTGAGAITIDNWSFIQQQFGIPEMSVPASTSSSSTPVSTSSSSTPASTSGSSAPASTSGSSAPASTSGSSAPAPTSSSSAPAVTK